LRNEKYNYLTRIIIIQFSSVYIRANITAQRPIVGGHKKLTNKIQNKAVCTLIIIIIQFGSIQLVI
jgi:hypothetical protein